MKHKTQGHEQNHHHLVRIDNLHCEGCVKSLKEKLSQATPWKILSTDLPNKQVSLEAEASRETVLKTLSSLGYQVTDVTANDHGAPSAEDATLCHTNDHHLPQETVLAIDGISCASCVAKLEKALNQVPGVEKAQVSLVDHTAQVLGSAPAQTLIRAVEATGYTATIAHDPDNTLAQRQQQEQLFYRRKLREMFFALSLGLPLMAYSFGVWWAWPHSLSCGWQGNTFLSAVGMPSRITTPPWIPWWRWEQVRHGYTP